MKNYFQKRQKQNKKFKTFHKNILTKRFKGQCNNLKDKNNHLTSVTLPRLTLFRFLPSKSDVTLLCIYTHTYVVFGVYKYESEEPRREEQKKKDGRSGQNDRARHSEIFGVSAAQMHESLGLPANCAAPNRSTDSRGIFPSSLSGILKMQGYVSIQNIAF